MIKKLFSASLVSFLSRRPNSFSISQSLFWFVVINTLLLGFLIIGLIVLKIDKTVKSSQDAHVNSQIQVIADHFTQYLGDRAQLLSDHAEFPVFVQGLMQPKKNTAIVQDFFLDLTFLGRFHQEVLIDFRGRTLVASEDSPRFEYQKQDAVMALLEGRTKTLYSVSENAEGHFWRIAQPILFNGIVEGALVIEIPLEDVMRQINWSSYFGGIALEIRDKGEVISRVGEIESSDFIVLEEPFTGVELYFYVDQKQARFVRNRLIVESFILIFCVAFLMAAVSIRLGKEWLVYPIRRLRSCTKFDGGELPSHEVPVDFVLSELVGLAQDFRKMVEEVNQREAQLRGSHSELEKVHADLKFSQAQLVHSEKMASLGILSAGVAHEVNNPLGFVKSNMHILSDYSKIILPIVKDYYEFAEKYSGGDTSLMDKINYRLRGESLQFLLEDIPPLLVDTQEGVARVQKIVEGLRSFSRVDEPQMQKFCINDCVDATLKIIESEVKYRCDLKISLASVPDAYGNQGEIGQVVLNLILNAVQATDGHGEVHIATGCSDTEVFVEVSDNGCGISQEHMDKLFTPFFTTKEVGSGTGLGLSISHGIVEKHSGSIDVESKLGVGSIFKVRLPIGISALNINSASDLRRV